MSWPASPGGTSYRPHNMDDYYWLKTGHSKPIDRKWRPKGGVVRPKKKIDPIKKPTPYVKPTKPKKVVHRRKKKKTTAAEALAN